jgi:DNA-binding PadR family transcriptional regulator
MNEEEKQQKEEFKELKRQLHAEKHLIMHRRNWLRHNAMVPKGFLRYHVLEALSEKPMSGSELMDQIQKNMGGTWKPSPGSIYPLLAFLQDNQYIRELPHENGLKRYELTQSGKTLLEEQTKIREKFRSDMGFMGMPFFGGLFRNFPEEKNKQIHGSMRRMLVSSMKLAKALKENYSEKDLDEALKVLNDSAQKLDEIRQKLGAKDEQQ